MFVFILGLVIGVIVGLVLAEILGKLGERRAEKIIAENERISRDLDERIRRFKVPRMVEIDNETTVTAIDGSTIRFK